MSPCGNSKVPDHLLVTETKTKNNKGKNLKSAQTFLTQEDILNHEGRDLMLQNKEGNHKRKTH